uniref:Uncharacterized protein n=1 Tax=Zea mays TaxID=4577 RepID=C0PLZ8_MAIZE|nr:unknown [Zea mays]
MLLLATLLQIKQPQASIVSSRRARARERRRRSHAIISSGSATNRVRFSFRLALTSGDAYSGVRGSAGHLSGVLGAVATPAGTMNPSVPQSGVIAANLGLRSGVCGDEAAVAPTPTPQSGVGTNRGLLRSGVRKIPLSGVAAPLAGLLAAAQSCMIRAAASAPSRLSAMSLSTCALGKRIRSRTGPPSDSESGDGGAVAVAVAAEAGRERSEVERRVSMSDSSRSRAPTWSAPDQARRGGDGRPGQHHEEVEPARA